MLSKYAFKMTVWVSSIKYTGYYVYNSGRRFKLAGVIRKGIHTPFYYLAPSERRLDHMDKSLSYDALDTRRRRTKTYDVERVLVVDIKDELETLEQEIVLRMI